jgi:acetyltransferase
LHNPADIWPPAMASGEYVEYMKRSVRGFLRHDDVDGLLGVLVSMDSPLHSDHDLVAAARAIAADNIERKPVALWLYGSGAQRQSAAINAERLAGVACFGDLDSAMMGLAVTWRHSELSRRRPPNDPAPARPRAMLPDEELILGEAAESFLRGYGLSFAPGGVAADAAQAAALAENIGYPVVLKIVSPAWSHKSDRGGVLLDLRERSAVTAGFIALQELFSALTPGAVLEGIQVQKQIQGVELLLGVKRDPQFGPVIAAGMGGIYTEILKDVILEPAPIASGDAERMLSGLRMAPLLEGARGTCIRRDAVVQALLSLSAIAMNHEEIVELDLNPVLVNADDCYCVDARIIRHL